MNILIVTGIFPPDAGGPATYVPTISHELTQRGHKVSVVTWSDSISHDDNYYDFPVVRIKRNLFKPLRLFFTVWAILRSGRQADVLFVNGLYLESVIANFVLNKPIVQKIVGDWAWERASNKGWTGDGFGEFQKHRNSVKVEALKALRCFLTRCADKVIVPSQFLADTVSEWDMPKERIVAIHNALETTDEIEPAEIPLQKQIKIVTVGRLVLWKRVDKIIEAIRQIEDIGLVIVGDGPERKNLNKVVETLELGDRVYFAGQRSKEETLALMAGCDIFILNSTYEGLPHVVLEAMSIGLPVIATAVGGTPELIVDGENGLLIETTEHSLYKSLQSLAYDSALRKRLSNKGQSTISKEFTIKQMSERTEKLLTESAAFRLQNRLSTREARKNSTR